MPRGVTGSTWQEERKRGKHERPFEQFRDSGARRPCGFYDHQRARAAELRYARITEADILAGKLVSPGSVLGVRAFKAFRNHMKQYEREQAAKKAEQGGKPMANAM